MFVHPQKYDVIVVGAGHAGIEAALCAARMGCRTLLLTMDLDTIGKMSCNPSVGGLAKGHIVRELDALGGQMGLTTDATAIQLRMLNRGKGPAVWAPRAQCDKKAYQFAMKSICERQFNLDVRQFQVMALVVTKDGVQGVDTHIDIRFLGTCVILTTGTFLHGLMHVGESRHEGGRGGEQAAMKLSENLIHHGFQLERLKTGTPPRLNRRTIRWEGMQEQSGDDPPPSFSFLHEPSYWRGVELAEIGCQMDGVMFHVEQSDSTVSDNPKACCSPHPSSLIHHNSPWSPPLPQISCHLTATTHRTAEIIRANLHRSPMYSGQIKGIGPRYCPSIEDKYVKFPDKPVHQIFLEPEGLNTDEIYVNGCSTSLPYDAQRDIVHSIQGLEHALIMRAGYAVEYDFAPPTQLYPWLETKCLRNLFFAGQINGTTGYEEAAAQGYVAGINAALRIQGKPPFIFSRTQSYIGVLVDDLVTKGTQEPYRMFTSRAEYRLILRQDNADERLTSIAYSWGLISKERHARFKEKMSQIQVIKNILRTTRLDGITLEQWLRRPENHIQAIARHLPDLLPEIPSDLQATIEMDIKYEGYVSRELANMERTRKTEQQLIPENINFQQISALRRETREKLSAIRPQTIAQASRISGITPADIGVLQIWIRKLKNTSHDTLHTTP